jgi:four helix bundle protein
MAESEYPMTGQILSFRDLEVWQAGMDLVVMVYDQASRLPTDERYRLATQMRRAAISVPSNVAEGHAFRTSPKAYRRYVRFALGSLAELETQLELTIRLHLLKEQNTIAVRECAKRTGQLLHGLLRSLR